MVPCSISSHPQATSGPFSAVHVAMVLTNSVTDTGSVSSDPSALRAGARPSRRNLRNVACAAAGLVTLTSRSCGNSEARKKSEQVAAFEAVWSRLGTAGVTASYWSRRSP